MQLIMVLIKDAIKEEGVKVKDVKILFNARFVTREVMRLQHVIKKTMSLVSILSNCHLLHLHFSILQVLSALAHHLKLQYLSSIHVCFSL
jgi:hypothetical protein